MNLQQVGLLLSVIGSRLQLIRIILFCVGVDVAEAKEIHVKFYVSGTFCFEFYLKMILKGIC
jgi:hypothetical protein